LPSNQYDLISPLIGKPSSSNAFLIPQWGGVVIWNPPDDGTTDGSVRLDHHQLDAPSLAPVFAIFRSHLNSLLGVPSLLSSSVSIEWVGGSKPLHQWQVDTLLRGRAVENTKTAIATLESIVKLVHQIPNMPVKKDVKQLVIDALDALDDVCISSLALYAS
jgi:phosphatidylinositol glycan class S